MTGPEHYREAERLLSFQYTEVGRLLAEEVDLDSVALAQVHATLALAAATAATVDNSDDNRSIIRDWQEACAW